MQKTTSIFRQSFIAHCQTALQQAENCENLDHPALVGQAREIFMSKMLQPALPPEVKLGTGKLVAFDGTKSPQIGVVLYAPSILPAWLYDPGLGMFPVESCLYSIEVKSRLTAANLSQAIASARKASQLPLIQTEHWTPVNTPKIVEGIRASVPLPIRALFAFSSDLVTDAASEMKRYRQCDEYAATPQTALSVMCIVGRGYWYAAGNDWKHVSASTDLDEIMSFLAGVANTVPQLLVAKGRPRFGKYIESRSAKHEPA